MAETRTEALHQNAGGLDTQAPDAILSALVNAQVEAASAVRNAIPAIATACSRFSTSTTVLRGFFSTAPSDVARSSTSWSSPDAIA